MTGSRPPGQPSAYPNDWLTGQKGAASEFGKNLFLLPLPAYIPRPLASPGAHQTHSHKIRLPTFFLIDMLFMKFIFCYRGMYGKSDACA